MNIPPKYEDVVAELADATDTIEYMRKERVRAEEREAALREELDRTKKAYEAYGIDFDRSEEKAEGLQQRLTVADQRVDDLEGLLRDADRAHGNMLLSDPPQEAWKYHRISERIAAALKPAEYPVSILPDFWPCKSAEELERFEAWKIEDGKIGEEQSEGGRVS